MLFNLLYEVFTMQRETIEGVHSIKKCAKILNINAKRIWSIYHNGNTTNVYFIP